jgi:aspartate carbamoyltransferase catalytic subunit
MEFAGRDIVSIKDFSREEIDYILKTTDSLEPMARKGSHGLDGRIMATLFFEPSTRTRLSFESAMYRHGGNCIGFAEPKISSVEKGENLADTVRVVESYADILVIRHHWKGLLGSRPISHPSQSSTPVPVQKNTPLKPCLTCTQFAGSLGRLTG